MMRSLGMCVAACLAVASLGTSVAIAAEETGPTVTDSTTVIDTLDVTTVGKLVMEVGGQRVETKEEGDNKVVSFYDGETPFLAIITLCDIKPGKCIALVQISVLSTGTTDVPVEAINKHNSENVLITAFKLEGNKIGFARAVIVDGGITRQNLAINIAAFVIAFGDSVKKLQNPLTSSLQLNRAPGASSLANVQFTPVRADPRHVQFLTNALLEQYKTTLGRSLRRGR
jgi:hypothetical protein